eukprot:TRINITY_DN2548_c0_g1_i1.p1 TRINITY_DN2548_c0_g1~~TRINITY_DN2548_c0_g1_i1.p1  ORF type:complete len:230 (-),score=27.40 TRINITY_DN2548_c0_g1_i1:86-775(-)
MDVESNDTISERKPHPRLRSVVKALQFLEHASPKKEPRTPLQIFRHKLGLFLEDHVFQIFILLLTLLDLIVIVINLYLEEHYKNCKDESEIPHAVEIAEEVLRYTSISILLILALELLLMMIAFGIEFFKHPLYLLDVGVIVLSLVFEIQFHDAVGGLLVIFRLWRIIRIIHTVAVTVEEHEKEKTEKLKEELKEQKKTIEKLQIQLNLRKSEYGSTSSSTLETAPLLM